MCQLIETSRRGFTEFTHDQYDNNRLKTISFLVVTAKYRKIYDIITTHLHFVSLLFIALSVLQDY